MTVRDDEGFAIVEVLVSLAVFGLISGLLLSVIGLGRIVSSATQLRLTQMDEVLEFRSLLSDTFGQLVASGTQSFSGTSSGLTVVGYGPRSLAISEPIQSTVKMGDGGHGATVIWQRKAAETPISRQILGSGRSVSFSYWPAPGRIWSTAWDDPHDPPRLVRTVIRDFRSRPIADFTISVRALRPSDCAISELAECH